MTASTDDRTRSQAQQANPVDVTVGVASVQNRSATALAASSPDGR